MQSTSVWLLQHYLLVVQVKEQVCLLLQLFWYVKCPVQLSSEWNYLDFLPLDPLKDPHICGRPQCEVENTKFNYASKIRYVYEYSSHIKSEFNGTGQNSSDIYVSATVELTYPKKCEGTLKIVDVELREHPIEDEANLEYASVETVQVNNLHINSHEFAADIQKYDLRYVFAFTLLDSLVFIWKHFGELSWHQKMKFQVSHFMWFIITAHNVN